MTQLPEVEEANFDLEVLNAGTPVLVEFTNDGCGLCKVMAPSLVQVAEEYEGEVRVVLVDTEKSPNVARRYNIQSVPQLFLFAEGGLKDKVLGLQSRGKLAEFLETNLGDAA
ncbi:Thioredoxin [compost metagenome]